MIALDFSLDSKWILNLLILFYSLSFWIVGLLNKWIQDILLSDTLFFYVILIRVLLWIFDILTLKRRSQSLTFITMLLVSEQVILVWGCIGRHTVNHRHIFWVLLRRKDILLLLILLLLLLILKYLGIVYQRRLNCKWWASSIMRILIIGVAFIVSIIWYWTLGSSLTSLNGSILRFRFCPLLLL